MSLSKEKRTRISKFLSLVLRHQPEKIGIRLDEAGWTSVTELLAQMNAHGFKISRDELEEVVRTNEKQRFAFSDDGEKIRANQGHSVEVELGYEPAAPPAMLYHGTIERFIPSIKAQGLICGARHHVHLSADVETAQAVGGRRGRAILLCVDATAMHAEGFAFFQSQNGVWLTEHVPTRFIAFE